MNDEVEDQMPDVDTLPSVSWQELTEVFAKFYETTTEQIAFTVRCVDYTEFSLSLSVNYGLGVHGNDLDDMRKILKWTAEHYADLVWIA